MDRRNNYRSHRIIDEMLEIISQIIEEPIIQVIRASQAMSLEVDESTDVSTSRQLDLHVRCDRMFGGQFTPVTNVDRFFPFSTVCEIITSLICSIPNVVFVQFRYLDNEGLVFNQLLDIVSVPDGRANTIVTAIKTVLMNKNMPTEKLYGIDTDGAAVMTGQV